MGLCLYMCIFSVCLFAHLLCVHTAFEQNFVIPLFFYLSHLHCCYPSLHQNMNNPLFFLICIRDVIQVEQKCYACFQKWYTSILLIYYSFKSTTSAHTGIHQTSANRIGVRTWGQAWSQINGCDIIAFMNVYLGKIVWSENPLPYRDLNPQPTWYQSNVLPTELSWLELLI